jgi:hypothetical protein
MEEVEGLISHGVASGLALSLLGVLLLLLPLAIPRLIIRRRRQFWCATAEERVEVEFAERGLPGFRRAIAVLSCSCFDPPSAIGCQRRCLDSTFPRQGPSAPGGRGAMETRSQAGGQR